MDDDFCVAGGLEDGTAMFEGAAQLEGVGEVAVVGQRQLALVAINDDGLGVDERTISGGGVARVAHRGRAGQALEHLRLKNLLHRAHAFFQVQRSAVGGDDARRLLPAMLQGIEAEVGEFGGFGMAEDSADTTVIVKMIVVYANHLFCPEPRRPRTVRSIAPAQASARRDTSALTWSLPFHWMRKGPRATAPISLAATPYCAARASTRARSEGASETTARAPRSPNRASSACSQFVQ